MAVILSLRKESAVENAVDCVPLKNKRAQKFYEFFLYGVKLIVFCATDYLEDNTGLSLKYSFYFGFCPAGMVVDGDETFIVTSFENVVSFPFLKASCSSLPYQ